MLKLREITYCYAAGRKALGGVSLEIGPGEILALAGRNGSGKTTLTRVVMGLLRPSGGAVELDGRDITRLGSAERARHIGYVFQNPDRQLFADTVRAEIAYAPRQLGLSGDALDAVVQDAAEAAQLEELLAAAPQSLRRGEKQRLAIASALSARPRLLILDEPTSGLDCRERTALLRLMRKFNQAGMAILLVTHDMDIIAEHAHRVAVLEGGALRYAGAPAALFGDEQLTLKLGLELPQAVAVGRELGLGVCLSARAVYRKLEERKQADV